MNTKFPIYLETTSKLKVSKFHIDLPYTYQDLLSEFENEEWVNPRLFNNHETDNWGNFRFKCMNPKSENRKLRELKDFFSSEELKYKFVHWLYDTDESMKWEWDWDPDEICRHTWLHGEFSKDTPGFENVIHTDFRKLLATGLVYWAKEDDPDLSTVFYDDLNRSNPVRMTTNFADGWFHSNGNNTWHEGWNRTNQMRYSTLLGLTLNITPI
jgi:hypothetical protein